MPDGLTIRPEGLTLSQLRVRLGDSVLVDLDAHVAPGEVLTVMGPSGSGKSTLLGAITGTLAPAFAMQGAIGLDGEDITARPTHRRRVGLMLQDDVLFPHLSVGGNLAFALDPSVRGRRARRARVEQALADAGLDGMADRDPATLSGGQRARVGLMRTLLAAPRAVLLDEPFSKLDTALRDQIRGFVFDRVRAEGLPCLLVTHDAADAAAAGGPVVAPHAD
ncbi:MAG: ATP-binding cassette domain-containing protein [Pseudomonadota bacterium]